LTDSLSLLDNESIARNIPPSGNAGSSLFALRVSKRQATTERKLEESSSREKPSCAPGTRE
jgi:hypothetical protein